MLLRAKGRVGIRDVARAFEEVGGPEGGVNDVLHFCGARSVVVYCVAKTLEGVYVLVLGVFLMGTSTCSLSEHVH